MLGFRKREAHREIGPGELHAMLEDGTVLLIDVREPGEFAAGHIPGAVNMPLSAFSPDDVPDPEGRTVVLQCAGGRRSGQALDQCAAAQAAIDTHLAGGIGAWKDAGLPVVGG
ncbi:rhodanese-like domain-containing protein [Sphingomonas sp. CL5.1]|uniref:rhodanese-like domain-containing protein n=1 Tax=Sphingomonas sp. CL5.1 TaxID=2653203 RepID=UPI0015821BF3|nr:rhodanese-like domain-containing protein [Sphingomonas sp. CL5.1]QKR99845.1 rhodanese-like domain-containing protein [Sphingomonas sp. CL5.1]